MGERISQTDRVLFALAEAFSLPGALLMCLAIVIEARWLFHAGHWVYRAGRWPGYLQTRRRAAAG